MCKFVLGALGLPRDYLKYFSITIFVLLVSNIVANYLQIKNFFSWQTNPQVGVTMEPVLDWNNPDEHFSFGPAFQIEGVVIMDYPPNAPQITEWVVEERGLGSFYVTFGSPAANEQKTFNFSNNYFGKGTFYNSLLIGFNFSEPQIQPAFCGYFSVHDLFPTIYFEPQGWQYAVYSNLYRSMKFCKGRMYRLRCSIQRIRYLDLSVVDSYELCLPEEIEYIEPSENITQSLIDKTDVWISGFGEFNKKMVVTFTQRNPVTIVSLLSSAFALINMSLTALLFLFPIVKIESNRHFVVLVWLKKMQQKCCKQRQVQHSKTDNDAGGSLQMSRYEEIN
jgi:hypothetical protein